MASLFHRLPKANHVKSHWEKVKPKVYPEHMAVPRLKPEERAQLIGELEDLKLQAQTAEEHSKSEKDKISARQSTYHIDEALKHLGVKKKR